MAPFSASLQIFPLSNEFEKEEIIRPNRKSRTDMQREESCLRNKKKNSFPFTRSWTGIGNVLDVSQLGFQVSDASTIVNQGADNDHDQQDRNDQTGY